LKCDKCGYVSFDYNHDCPVCSRDLAVTRSRLGIQYDPPEADFDELFTGQSGGYTTVAKSPAARQQEEEPELDLDSVGDEFEFTLDD
jgi:ribosomal protein L37AE/L43A